MSATYDPTLPTDRDLVRRLIGDVDMSNALISDEEINALLTRIGSAYLTAATLADGLAGQYAKSVSFSVEGLSISNTQKYEHFLGLAARLRSQATLADGGLGTPFVGGVSKGEMQSVDDDTDKEPNRFKVGNMDYPGVIVPPERTS